MSIIYTYPILFTIILMLYGIITTIYTRNVYRIYYPLICMNILLMSMHLLVLLSKQYNEFSHIYFYIIINIIVIPVVIFKDKLFKN